MAEPIDPAALRAKMDQAQQTLRDLSPPIAQFWKSLVAEGMSETAATACVVEWLRMVTIMGLQQQQGGQS